MLKKIVCAFLILTFTLGMTVIVSSQEEEAVDCLSSVINRQLEEALLEEFGTTNPLEIGEEPYTRFLNDFVDRHNERNKIGNVNNNSLMEGTCAFCGRTQSITTTITWGAWLNTENIRVAGVFPNQFIENEQMRHGTRQTFTGCCNRLLSASQVSETRWVRA